MSEYELRRLPLEKKVPDLGGASCMNWLECLRKLLNRNRPNPLAAGHTPKVKRVKNIDLGQVTIQPSWIYLDHRNGKDRWLHMQCPCGCGDLLSLNLMTSQRPYWTLKWHSDGTVSVIPSVHKITGCRSHFFIIRSSIIWAGDSNYQFSPRNDS